MQEFMTTLIAATSEINNEEEGRLNHPIYLVVATQGSMVDCAAS